MGIKSILHINRNKINQQKTVHQQTCLSGPFQSPHQYLCLNVSLPYSLLLPVYSIYVRLRNDFTLYYQWREYRHDITDFIFT